MPKKPHQAIHSEWLNSRFGYFYTVSKTIHSCKTDYQKLDLVNTDEFGRVLILDGITQVAQSSEFAYHEPMVHPAMCAHPCPRRVLVIGAGDGGIIREVVKYPCVESVVLAELDRISERGGVLGAMETGYQRGRIQDDSMIYEHAKHSGSLPIVGVNAVAACASDIGLGVRRAFEIGMRSGVAAQALGIHLFGCTLRWVEDLGRVAAAIDVRLARTVAVFAGDAALAMHLGHFGVRIGGELPGHFFVAGGADFGADKIPWSSVFGLRGSRFCAGRRSREYRRAQYCSAKQQQTSSQSRPLARSRTDRTLRERPNALHRIPPWLIS